MKHKWQKFHCLPRTDQWLLFQAMLLLPLVALTLRLGGFNRTQAILSRLTSPSPSSQAPAPNVTLQAKRIAHLVRLAARHSFIHANCLHQSLALWWLLRRRNIDSQLRIGVRKIEHRLEAHAWIELSGQVLNDSPDVNEHFAPFHEPLDLAKTPIR